MEGYGRKPRRDDARRYIGRYKAEADEMIERRERLTLRNEVEPGKHLEIYGGLIEGIGMKMYLHGPMDFAKTPKLRLRVGGLDLSERRKRCTSSQKEEEKVDAQMCPRGEAIESRARMAG